MFYFVFENNYQADTYRSIDCVILKEVLACFTLLFSPQLLGGHILIYRLRHFGGSTAMFYFIFQHNYQADRYRSIDCVTLEEVLPCSTLFSNTIIRRTHIDLQTASLSRQYWHVLHYFPIQSLGGHIQIYRLHRFEGSAAMFYQIL